VCPDLSKSEFTIKDDRFIGDKDKLIANDPLGENAALSMPAFDADFDAHLSGFRIRSSSMKIWFPIYLTM
jgi:hypothetical protein